jgi:hypothetical protein
MHVLECVALVLAGATSRVFAAGTVQLAWTTDINSPSWSLDGSETGKFGPDGPWQALAIFVGNSSTRKSDPGFYSPMWPSGVSLSMALTTIAGGNYSVDNSTTAIKTSSRMGMSDSWFSSVFQNETSDGQGVLDTVSLRFKQGGDPFRANTSLNAVNSWVFGLPGGNNFSARVGILGLGPDVGSSRPQGGRDQPFILQQLKTAGQIASNSFGMHIGGAALGQPGSLVLGGYEQNRALGQVGVFPIQSGIPSVFLLDVIIGTETGASPFNRSDEGSVYQGLGGNTIATEITKSLGGRNGSAVMIPNPAAPYIYMPLGTCEAAARRLPVIWAEKLGLYVWNTTDPLYTRIVKSPAYLAFILADRSAHNITVKVPFALLNLTLEAPLVTTRTPYFPCKPYNSSYGFWQFGRAFLQAAFLGIDFEQNVTFIAQGPGPDMDQSVVQTLQPGDTTLKSNPIESFERSWRSTWTVLTADPTPPSDLPIQQATGLPTGAVAGIVVGVIVVVAAAIATAFLCWRRRKGQAQKLDSMRVPSSQAFEEPNEPGELDGRNDNMHEIGKPLPHETEVPYVNHEAPDQPVFELPEEPKPR